MSFHTALILVLCCSSTVVSNKVAVDVKARDVLLWVASPFGFWGGEFNQTKLDAFLHNTSLLKHTVDIISPTAFFLADPNNATQLNGTGGLVVSDNVGKVISSLQNQGFRVQPLIGNFYSTNKIALYRYYWGQGRGPFIKACAHLVSVMSLDGLNFDFEPASADCKTSQPPCNEKDAQDFSQLLTDVRTALHATNTSKYVSVDTGQSIIAKTNVLNGSSADNLITMNTYGDTADFDIALPRDLGRCGADRFTLGICPGCYNSSAQDIAHRMGLATSMGVRHVAWWAGASGEGIHNESMWWDAIRKWKAARADPRAL
jgi:hypothetical protein